MSVFFRFWIGDSRLPVYRAYHTYYIIMIISIGSKYRFRLLENIMII